MSYDYLITNGTIIDGIEHRAWKGDIVIKDGRTSAIGPSETMLFRPDLREGIIDAGDPLVIRALSTYTPI